LVLLDNGLDELAQQFPTLISNGQWGSGTANPSPTDTTLLIPISATDLSMSSTNSGNTSEFTHTVNSSTANGSAFSEFGIKFSDGTFLNRSLGGTFTKQSSFDVITITTINFTRG